MSFNVKITGLETIKAAIDKKQKDVEKIVQDQLKGFAEATVADAKKLCPVDEGHLRNSISHKTERLKVSVIVAAKYAAYVEFGTRGRTDIPAGWNEFAAQFKGKGQGDYYDFLNAILDWVKRKGIAARFSVKTRKAINIKLGSGSEDEKRLEQAAQAIAYSIIRHGIKPHPFFIPAIESNKLKLKNTLDKLGK